MSILTINRNHFPGNANFDELDYFRCGIPNPEKDPDDEIQVFFVPGPNETESWVKIPAWALPAFLACLCEGCEYFAVAEFYDANGAMFRYDLESGVAKMTSPKGEGND